MEKSFRFWQTKKWRFGVEDGALIVPIYLQYLGEHNCRDWWEDISLITGDKKQIGSYQWSHWHCKHLLKFFTTKQQMRYKAIREYRQRDILLKTKSKQINSLFAPFIWTLRAAPLMLMHFGRHAILRNEKWGLKGYIQSWKITLQKWIYLLWLVGLWSNSWSLKLIYFKWSWQGFSPGINPRPVFLLTGKNNCFQLFVVSSFYILHHWNRLRIRHVHFKKWSLRLVIQGCMFVMLKRFFFTLL